MRIGWNTRSSLLPRLVIAKILNHTESGVTAIYDRASYDREKRAALDAWAVLLDAILATTD
jgi:hypothetical protein